MHQTLIKNGAFIHWQKLYIPEDGLDGAEDYASFMKQNGILYTFKNNADATKELYGLAAGLENFRGWVQNYVGKRHKYARIIET